MIETMIDEQQAVLNVADNLRRILDSRDWSQRDLARAVGEYDANISRVLHGKHAVRYTLLAKIAVALDVSMDRLVASPPEKILQGTG
jgi:transcriptional regulator with XRE-family HTH domain